MLRRTITRNLARGLFVRHPRLHDEADSKKSDALKLDWFIKDPHGVPPNYGCCRYPENSWGQGQGGSLFTDGLVGYLFIFFILTIVEFRMKFAETQKQIQEIKIDTAYLRLGLLPPKITKTDD